MMTIYIVRHGETEENLQRILQGHMPGILTELGKDQVQRAAEQLSREGVKFTRIVSSDLKRAMDSAHIIADRLNLPIIPMEILRERDWGKFTGMSIAEAADKYLVDGKWHFPGSTSNREQSSSLELPRCEGGRPIGQGTTETEEGIYERACKALVELQKLFANETIIVVTHGQFARNIMAAHFKCSYHEVASFINAEIRTLKI